MDSDELERACREHGFGKNAVEQGRRLAGVKAYKVGFPPNTSWMVTLTRSITEPRDAETKEPDSPTKEPDSPSTHKKSGPLEKPQEKCKGPDFEDQALWPKPRENIKEPENQSLCGKHGENHDCAKGPDFSSVQALCETESVAGDPDGGV
jgi:hypothetical protein